MEICTICYESRLPIKFFYLSCCQHNNKLCSFCLENLVDPKCPYCRQPIHGLNNKKKKRKNTEEDTNWVFSLYDQTSRIERRQMRRLIKLEMREEDRERNRRMRSFSI